MSVLQKQVVSVVPAELDTKADPKTAPLGKLAVVENLYQAQAGKWQCRNGVTALGRGKTIGGSISSGKGLAIFDDQRLMVDNTTLYSMVYDENLAWQPIGPAVPMSIRAEKVAGSIRSRKCPDAAISPDGRLMCVANVDDFPRVVVSVIDTVTGNRVLNDVDTGMHLTPTGCFVLALVSEFVIVAQGQAASNIQAATIQYLTPGTVDPISTLVTDANGDGRMDIIRRGTNDDFLLAYHSTTVGKKTRIRRVLSNLTLGGDVGNADESDQCIGWLNWDNSDGFHYLAYAGSAVGAKLLQITTSTTTIFSTTTIDAAVTSARNCTGWHASGPTNRVFFEVAGAATYLNKVLVWTGSGATSVWQLGCGLASKAFKTTSSGNYVTLAFEDTIQNVYFVAEASGSTPNIVGRALYGLGGGVSKTASNLPQVPNLFNVGPSFWMLPCLRFSYNASGTFIYDVYYLKLDFGAQITGYKRLGDNLHLHGGCLRVYDGTLATELGHHLAPTIYGLTGAAGGSMTPSSTYQVTAIYFWIDNRGQIHRSAPAAVQSVALTAGQNSITFNVTYSRISDKVSAIAGTPFNNVWVEIYLTASNGKTFYRVATNINDTSSDSLATGYSSADSSFTGNPTLYTTGGVLPHITPPPARLAEVFGDRLILGGTEYGTEVWVSNERVTGDGISFSDVNAFQMESDGGDLTAFAEMDDKLLIFKRDAIYVMSGAGPDLKGNGNYDRPQKISVKVGSIGPVVQKTPDGVIFQSVRGFYIVTRGLDVQYLGAPVEGYTSQVLNHPTTWVITAALTVESLNQARFYTSVGTTLVYDWYFKRWSVFTGQTAVAAMVWPSGGLGQSVYSGGVLFALGLDGIVYLQSDGKIQQEVPQSYADNGALITTKWQTTWMTLGQLLGYLRLYRIEMLVEALSSQTWQVQVAVDWNPTVVQTATIAETTASPVPLEMVMIRPKVQAVQLTIQNTGAAGQGFTLSAMGFEIGMKPGMGHRPVAQVIA